MLRRRLGGNFHVLVPFNVPAATFEIQIATPQGPGEQIDLQSCTVSPVR